MVAILIRSFGDLIYSGLNQSANLICFKRPMLAFRYYLTYSENNMAKLKEIKVAIPKVSIGRKKAKSFR
jgi:hypothetical protein